MTLSTAGVKPTCGFAEHDDCPDEDSIVLLANATWDDYERLLEIRGERAIPRMAYLDGVLELMTPSRPHESLRSKIGQLVEVWCLEKGIEFSAYGAWTLKSKRARRGAEADECYVFGVVARPKRPDLAIEVIWRSGGLDKLDIYCRLGVREVWFWQHGQLSVHVLREQRYEQAPASEVLPGIDVAELCACLDRPTDSESIREYRARIQHRRASV